VDPQDHHSHPLTHHHATCIGCNLARLLGHPPAATTAAGPMLAVAQSPASHATDARRLIQSAPLGSRAPPST
jgi:hypothetical protein